MVSLSDLLKRNDKQLVNDLVVLSLNLFILQDLLKNRLHLAATCIMQSFCLLYVLYCLLHCWLQTKQHIKLNQLKCEGSQRVRKVMHTYQGRQDDDDVVVVNNDHDSDNKKAYTYKNGNNNNYSKAYNSEKLTRISENSKPTSKYFSLLSFTCYSLRFLCFCMVFCFA